jgi:hypothetical protein
MNHTRRSSPAWRARIIIIAGALSLMIASLSAQSQYEREHRRGRLWELVGNDGWIGSLGAWDFGSASPLGMFPGFKGYTYPFGNEDNATNTFSNANYHNFRSGCWIVAKDLLTPGGPPTYTAQPTPYEVYESGMQESFSITGCYGVATTLQPLGYRQNFAESSQFEPLLPEEMTDGFWYTNTGIRVTRRSYVWSYPGYSDFIIYDYIFKFTGEFIANSTLQIVPNPSPELTGQTLSGVYFVFHSGISVSTKSPINFTCDVEGIMAGASGYGAETYHDYYHREDNGELVFSTNFNGGKAPHPNSYAHCIKQPSSWQQRFGNEMFSPAAFGWVALYADPLPGRPARADARPDVLRIDSARRGQFQGQPWLAEYFRQPNLMGESKFYEFATTPDTQATLGNNGDRFNFYTLTYGPYTLAPGDSVRIIVGEIAGVMDYKVVNAGDPDGWFPDSSIAALHRNVANARNAVKWGRGGTKNGIPIAADAPEPPPPPKTTAANISEGSAKAIIGVTWDNVAETAVLYDGSGGVFYDGVNDLDGYRIYRSTDFQYSSDTEPPVLRGAWWDLLADIPKTEMGNYWDGAQSMYVYKDTTVVFGFRYGYYVSAYNDNPRPWTSANGTVVSTLPTLESGSALRSEPSAAQPGPVMSFDIFVAPNPYVYGDLERSFGASDPYKIEFRNLPEKCTIRIYTLMGDLVKTLHHGPDAQGNLSGSQAWDQKSDSGLLVAPALYIYNVESETAGLDKTLTGKFMIIR